MERAELLGVHPLEKEITRVVVVSKFADFVEVLKKPLRPFIVLQKRCLILRSERTRQ